MADSNMKSSVNATALDDFQFLEHSMRKRVASFCEPLAMERMVQACLKLLREDAPKLLRHQIEDLCLMKAQEGTGDEHSKLFGGPRGGLLCEIAGAGKTVISLLHAQMSGRDGPVFVLATRSLIQDVWQPQIKTWLKDTSHVSLISEKDVRDHLNSTPTNKSKRQFVLLNMDSLVLVKDLWPKLKRLQPTYLFVDEGCFLRNASGKKDMVEGLQHQSTLTWVVCAMPFATRRQDASAASFFEEAPAYDAITQPQSNLKTVRQKAKVKSIFQQMKGFVMGDHSPKDQACIVEREDLIRRFHFIIRHSPCDIERFLPTIRWLETEYEDDEHRKKRFLKILANAAAKQPPGKVLVAGLSDAERKEVSDLLKDKNVAFVNLKGEANPAAAVAKFADEKGDMQVALMSDKVHVGIDSLKAAQTVLFWSDKHADYVNTDTQTTIIKRVCRLGCVHKSIGVAYFVEEVELAPSPRKSRVSAACASTAASTTSEAELTPEAKRRRLSGAATSEAGLTPVAKGLY